MFSSVERSGSVSSMRRMNDAAGAARERPVVDGGARPADVEVAGGARGEADADGVGHEVSFDRAAAAGRRAEVRRLVRLGLGGLGGGRTVAPATARPNKRRFAGVSKPTPLRRSRYHVDADREHERRPARCPCTEQLLGGDARVDDEHLPGDGHESGLHDRGHDVAVLDVRDRDAEQLDDDEDDERRVDDLDVDARARSRAHGSRSTSPISAASPTTPQSVMTTSSAATAHSSSFMTSPRKPASTPCGHAVAEAPGASPALAPAASGAVSVVLHADRIPVAACRVAGGRGAPLGTALGPVLESGVLIRGGGPRGSLQRTEGPRPRTSRQPT